MSRTEAEIKNSMIHANETAGTMEVGYGVIKRLVKQHNILRATTSEILRYSNVSPGVKNVESIEYL